MPITRASNADKHPGLAVTADVKPRRSSQQVAADREAKEREKEAKKTAKLYAEVVKGERLNKVTTNVTAEDASYATPVAPRASSKRKARPLQRTESVLDLQPERNAPTSMTMPPPPLPASKPVKQVKKQDTSAKAASAGTKSKSAPAGAKASTLPVEVAGSSAPAKPEVQPGEGAGATAPTKPKKCRADNAGPAPAKASDETVKSRPKPVMILRPTAPSLTDDVEMAPAGTNIPERAMKYYGGLPANDPPPPGPQPARTASGGSKPHHVPPMPKPTAAGGRTGVGAPGPSRSKVPEVAPEDDSATEDDSQAPEPQGANDNSVTEDDSQAFSPGEEDSETEFSDPQPKKKQKTHEDPKIKGKATNKKLNTNKKQATKVIREGDSSEVEIVAESKKKKPVPKVIVKKEAAPKTSVKKEPVVPPALPVHQKAYRDKMAVGVNSHTYLKEQAGGIWDISSWTADVIPGLKPPTVNRSGTTPSLTTSKSRTATRPPSSVALRASVFTNIVRVSGTAEDSTHEKGALSDCDKTVGEESEAKKCSPIKDGVRLSSNGIVKLEPGTPAPNRTARKPARTTNKSLPEAFQEGTIWKMKVTPSIIKWAGTFPKIFKIPVSSLIPVLEVVCRYYYEDDTITIQDHKHPAVVQMQQRLIDQFRGPMGSAAISVLLAYLAACPLTKTSDVERVSWCKEHLENSKFVYGNTSSPDPVRWKQAYQSGLIIQIFAVYLSAIKNVPWLLGMFPNSDDPSTPHPEPRPALALAVAALERAMTLVADGKITTATIQASKIKGGKLIIADIHPVTRKAHIGSIAFSEGLWGSATKEYCINIAGLRRSDMDKIVLAARRFSRATAGAQNTEESQCALAIPTNEQGARIRIPLNYDSDSDAEEEVEDAGGEHAEDEGIENVDAEDEDSEDEDMQAFPPAEQSDEDIELEKDAHPVEDYGEEEYAGAYRNPYDDDDAMEYEDGHAPEAMEADEDEVHISPAYK
ncbi:hypothetical protein FIBSPDRAFT_963702 [Athelia psychrophila]|uniref:Uncharacterized protein n=1 Tax=Athelia psychrophila TaxID=1759441 RepID=A0A165YNP3_9AGAM|nr:hypothetical protein FIBSPDRAFT_963702 [Fibularhizoctonia sp. CBS 109695]